MKPASDLTWITNHPKPLKGMWPRRIGVEYIEGSPKGTHMHSSDELSAQGIIGVYVDMDLADYYGAPIAKTPRDMP